MRAAHASLRINIMNFMPSWPAELVCISRSSEYITFNMCPVSTVWSPIGHIHTTHTIVIIIIMIRYGLNERLHFVFRWLFLFLSLSLFTFHWNHFLSRAPCIVYRFIVAYTRSVIGNRRRRRQTKNDEKKNDHKHYYYYCIALQCILCLSSFTTTIAIDCTFHDTWIEWTEDSVSHMEQYVRNRTISSVRTLANTNSS